MTKYQTVSPKNFLTAAAGGRTGENETSPALRNGADLFLHGNDGGTWKRCSVPAQSQQPSTAAKSRVPDYWLMAARPQTLTAAPSPREWHRRQAAGRGLPHGTASDSRTKNTCQQRGGCCMDPWRMQHQKIKRKTKHTETLL